LDILRVELAEKQKEMEGLKEGVKVAMQSGDGNTHFANLLEN